MRKILIILFGLYLFIGLFAEYPEGSFLLKKIDENMYSENIISVAHMTINSRRSSKTMKFKSWKQGEETSFTEYLYPPRDAGTKMLKLEDNLWIYNPSADRTIQISGHMLRQSVMGSDLSYEDLMEESEISTIYKAEVIGEDIFNDTHCWIMLLTAKIPNVAYYSRKIWIDKNRFLALKEERFGKSGKLLKTISLENIVQVGNRWYPSKMIFKDELKKGKGTIILIDSIEFDVDIPESTFSKAALRK